MLLEPFLHSFIKADVVFTFAILVLLHHGNKYASGNHPLRCLSDGFVQNLSKFLVILPGDGS